MKSFFAVLGFTIFLFGAALGYVIGINPNSYHFETISPICHPMERDKGEQNFL